MHKRDIESSAFTAAIPVLVLLPAWLVAMFLIHLVVSPFVSTGFGMFLLIAALASVVMFLPITQKLFVTRLLGVRSPTAKERARLEPAVKTVAQAARVSPERFVLAVDDSNDVNAFACGGHILVVSSYSLERLSEHELTGVVAHEMSHHLGAHTVALSIGQWLSLPIVVCARVGFVLQGVASRIERRLRRTSRTLGLAGRGVIAVITAVAWVFEAALLVGHMVNNVVGKEAEFQADARAVRLGFGRQLSGALAHVMAQGTSPRPLHWRERIFASHPPARTRMAKIEAQLRARDRRR
jgi:Zn-dependent protease with chaperone function